MTRSLIAAFLALSVGLTVVAQSPRQPSISQDDLRTWLTYIASDELQGRQVYTEGIGLAAAYIAECPRPPRYGARTARSSSTPCPSHPARTLPHPQPPPRNRNLFPTSRCRA